MEPDAPRGDRESREAATRTLMKLRYEAKDMDVECGSERDPDEMSEEEIEWESRILQKRMDAAFAAADAAEAAEDAAKVRLRKEQTERQLPQVLLEIVELVLLGFASKK